MGSVTLSELRHGLRRWVAPAVAIVLGVAFLTTTLAARSTLNATVEQFAAGQVAGFDAAVSAPESASSATGLTPAQLQTVRKLPGVDRVAVEQRAETSARIADGPPLGVVARTVDHKQLTLLEGRTPAGPGQVVLSESAASALGASLGSTVTVGGTPGVAERRTVGGIVRVMGSAGMPIVVGTPAELTRWSGATTYDAFLVRGNGDQSGVADRLRAALGDDVTVRTADAEVAARVDRLVVGIGEITMFFAMFAIVAMFVSALVIANTFQILLAQRSRQLALLRCVGASRRQVMRSVVAEAVALGLVASAMGVALGLAPVAGLAAVSDTVQLVQLPIESLRVSALELVLPLAVGLVVTVLAAVQPARRASRVAPLAALRPELSGPARTRASRVRLLVGGVVGAAGLSGLVLSAQAGLALPAVLSGVLSFLGVVLTAPVVVPLLARGLGRAARLAGVPGELATDNTVRNPRRTAATSTALLVGITLITTMLVGAQTSRTVIADAVDAQYALDVSVDAAGQAIPPAVVDRLARVDGVERSTRLRAARVTVTGPRTSEEQTVMGLSPDATAVLRDPDAVTGSAPGVVLVDEEATGDLGVRDGDPLRLGAVTLRARTTDRSLESFVVTTSDLARIAPDAAVAGMWLRLAPDADAGKVVGELTRVTAGTGVDVGGSAGARAELDKLVNLMLAIVTGLLGVAVVIALVGVANTLGLSVLERQRETALLRALGFTRRQVRRTLAVEALLVALVAAVLGTGLGVLYGWAGTRALLGRFAEGAAPQLPWLLLTAVVLAAAACGLLASWAPGRRAARTSPVAALAAD